MARCLKCDSEGATSTEGLCWECEGAKHKHNKYRVAAKKNRTWNGIIFASKAEKIRAMELDGMRLWMTGEIIPKIITVLYQPKFRLGVSENVYVADFLVIPEDGKVWAEDIKGTETPKFKRDKRLWKRYGRLPLRILKRVRNGWSVQEIVPRGETADSPD